MSVERYWLIAVAAVTTLLLAAVARPGFTDEPKPAGEATQANTAGPATEGQGAESSITVSVGPGAQALDPTAIPQPFCDAEGATCVMVADTIARDLTISGFFKNLDPASFIANMEDETLAKTKWEDWFNVGAKYLIKSKISSTGGKYDLSFRLYDVNRKKAITVSFQEATVSKDGVRGATHNFVNEVIRAITGVPGPFGGKILFAAKTGKGTKGVYSIGVDGYGRNTIAGGETINMLPSMVGGDVLYTSFKAGKPALYLNGKRITSDGRSYRGARLSPDGGGIAASADDGGQSDIFLMSRSGKIKSNLTRHWADEVSPCWSPDGSKIAFVSNRTGSPQVYVMGADGSGQRRLTMAGGYNSTPDFGPGGLVVFAGMDEAHSDIFTVNLEGHITRITQDQGSNRDPTISPDGRHLAFVSSRDGKRRIWISTIDGRYQFPITEKSRSYSTLSWAR